MFESSFYSNREPVEAFRGKVARLNLYFTWTIAAETGCDREETRGQDIDKEAESLQE